MTWKLISHIEKLLPRRLNDDLIDHSMFSWKVKNILYCISTVERIFDSIVYYSSWNWFRKVGLTLKLTIDFVKGGFFRGSHFVVALRKLPMETDCSIKPTQANSVLLTHFGRKKNKWTIWTVQLKEDAYGVFISSANRGESHEKIITGLSETSSLQKYLSRGMMLQICLLYIVRKESWQIWLLNKKLRIKCSLDGVKVYLQKAKRHLWFSNPTEFNIMYTHVTPMDCWDMWKTKMEADKQDSRSPFCRSRKTWKQKTNISENIYLIKELESEFIHILIAILLHMKIPMLKDTMDICTII